MAISMDQKHNSSSPKTSTFGRLRQKLSPKNKAHKDTRSPSPSIKAAEIATSHSSSQLRRVFNYFDENGDGRISPAELQNCLRTVGGELSIEDAEAAVQSSDLDGDGLLDFNEFQKIMEEDKNNNSELRDAFGMYIMEGSNYITPDSLKRMLTRIGESTSIDDCKAMIRAFDLNGDGVLSFHEFAIMMH